RAEVHDGFTELPGSWKRSIAAIRFRRSHGLRVAIANVLMIANMHDHQGVQALARELGVRYNLDPTITPVMDGNTSILSLRIPGDELNSVFHTEGLIGNAKKFSLPPIPRGAADPKAHPCTAGHSSSY